MMADTQQTENGEATVDESTVQETTGTDSVPAQETDWKAEARKWEERAKSNKAQVSQLQAQLTELEGTSGDLEKALERIGALEKHNQELEHSRLVADVASAKQVDAGLLVGSTREELEAHADKLLAWRGERPARAGAPLLGYQPSNSPQISDTKKLVRQLMNKE